MSNQTLEDNRDTRSLGDLFGELAGETSNLIKQEINLASMEIGRNLKNLSNSLLKGAVAFMLATCGLLLCCLGLVLVISFVIPLWLSAFVVGVFIGGVAFVLVRDVQAELAKNNIAPVNSIDTIKEDAQWIKNQIAP